MTNISDYYAILGVRPNSDDVVVQAAYRALIRKYHPDTNKSPDATIRCAKINEAYATLGDPTKRKTYDRIRQERADAKNSERSSPPPPPPPPPQSGPQERGAPNAHDGAATLEHEPAKISKFVWWIILAGIILLIWVGNTRSTTTSTGEQSPAQYQDTSSSEENGAILAADNALDAASNSVILDVKAPQELPVVAVQFDNIERAARSFDRVLNKAGIAGARKYSESCHSAVARSPSWNGADECAAFDFAARFVDQGMVTVAGIPANNYFAFKSENEADDYSLFQAPSYVVAERIEKIRKFVGPVVTQEIEDRISRNQRRAKVQAAPLAVPAFPSEPASENVETK